MTTAYIGLGSNMGDRRANLRAALIALARSVRITAVSSLYETDPVGPPQENYYNAVAAIETDRAPAEVLGILWQIERDLGREPIHERNAPRPIDLDILLFGALRLNSSRLTVPHPRLAERAFVLVPLREIAGDVRHPVIGHKIDELADDVGNEGVRLVAKRGWETAG
ncbi:MAG: 2-amino-4-hydroxy-6-hydroxymethyldihydropteridine diphosphokinase [Chloroflexota bacterium]